MDDKIKAMLAEPTHPDNIQKLLVDCKHMLKYSRGKMRSHHMNWDKNLRIWRGYRDADEEDLQAATNDEPQKSIIPNTYTQVMVFTTFAYLLLRSRPRFFELEVADNADYPLQETCESFLERDLRHNQFGVKLMQILLDIARMGIAVTKTTWKRETVMVNVPMPDEPNPVGVEGVPFAMADEVEAPDAVAECVKFEGNEIVNVSPYSFIPDMRMPLTRWQEGQFCADEQIYHIKHFKKLEKDGVLVGTEHISRIIQKDFDSSNRMEERFALIDIAGTKNSDTDFMLISTEGQYRIVPKDYGLSESTEQEDWLITYANDMRIVRAERMEYCHHEFIYDVSQFIPDVHAKLNNALADSIGPLQELVTWLINARMMSLRQGLDRHLVVDPSVIDMAGLEARSPIIQLRKGAPRTGIQNFIQQLRITDPTAQNMMEADAITKLMMGITGINENAMGQYAPGRRSAAENQSANKGSSSRIIFHISLICEQHLQPLGRKMLSNLRQQVSKETFKKVIGRTSPTPGLDIDQLFDMFSPLDIRELIGNEDFFVFDMTTGSDKQYTAVALQELVSSLTANPQIIQMTGFDLDKLITTILNYRGVRNVSRLKSAATTIPVQRPVGAATGLPIDPTTGGPPPIQGEQGTVPVLQ